MARLRTSSEQVWYGAGRAQPPSLLPPPPAPPQFPPQRIPTRLAERRDRVQGGCGMCCRRG